MEGKEKAAPGRRHDRGELWLLPAGKSALQHIRKVLLHHREVRVLWDVCARARAGRGAQKDCGGEVKRESQTTWRLTEV